MLGAETDQPPRAQSDGPSSQAVAFDVEVARYEDTESRNVVIEPRAQSNSRIGKVVVFNFKVMK